MKEIYTSISYPYIENDIIHIDQELYLEPINTTVLKPLYKLMDKDREYLSEYLPWAAKQTQESLEKFIEISIENRRLKHEFVYLIRKNKDILGCITLLGYKASIFGIPGHTNIGYYLFVDYQGHGYMKKAILALTSLYYINHNINRFQIEIRGENLKSINVAKSIGAKFEGIARKLNGHDNMHVYSYILPEDFINHNQQVERNAKAYAKEAHFEELEIPNAVYESSIEAGNVETSANANTNKTKDANLPEGNVESFGNVNIIVDNKEHKSVSATNTNTITTITNTAEDTNNFATATIDNTTTTTVNESTASNDATSVIITETSSNFNHAFKSLDQATGLHLSDEDLAEASVDLSPTPIEQLVNSLEASVESQIATASDLGAGVFSDALDKTTEQAKPKTPVENTASENDLDAIVDEALLSDIELENNKSK